MTNDFLIVELIHKLELQVLFSKLFVSYTLIFIPNVNKLIMNFYISVVVSFVNYKVDQILI